MKKIIVLIGIVILLTGCTDDSKLRTDLISPKEAGKEVQSFFETAKKQNGIHLYQDKDEKIYLMLNGANILQDQPAITFSNFKVKEDGDTLKVYYEVETVADYEDKNLENQLFYEVELNKAYETIQLYKNGKPSNFEMVSGNTN
ncbi:lipoprotein [Fictibacillus sp. 18YEL24]|uniref:lipoprotein n=1 Tax=Fictibacillus sp. 18YEL24 TaxID=2745875 RepID=UPI0018CEB619|nr:lipoprotein [Fictibacillus sp. 18YEL24]MBH0170184.1 lipoprotein [Fictibacillus sp. 18YEL24]